MSKYRNIVKLLDALPYRFPLDYRGIQIYRTEAARWELDGVPYQKEQAAVMLLERRIEIKQECRQAAFLASLEN